MTIKRFFKVMGTVAALATTVSAWVLITSPRLKVKADDNSSESRIQQGFDVAPVHLNLNGKNRALVGLGSYFVNGVGNCNICHNPGPGINEFAQGGNPFFGEPVHIDPAKYLGGGRNFGPLVPGSADIISRNLTPDSTGLPEGGHTFAEFLQIIRTGVDLDFLHPTCPAGTVNASCIPRPFDGTLLQIMEWPQSKNITDHDLLAIYEYLSAVPCIAGPPAPDPLHNDCGLTASSSHLEIAAGNDEQQDESRIQKGFDIAPVPLNLNGKDRALVGLGSYLVNGPGHCNACHNPGPGDNEYVSGANPFFGQPEQINQGTYLGGGRNFGPVVPDSANIITRNLTPDKTGLPEAGRTFAEFVQIMRTGADLDSLHPPCPVGTVNTSCVPRPYDGTLLQVMPWFAFQNMTDHDLRAIYEYLSAIPCVAGPPAPDPRHHDCP